MTAPAIVITLALEARPRVWCDFLTTQEADRVLDWVDQHPEYRELLDLAVELQGEERAA